MPQLDLSTYLSQFFWLILFLSILYYCINNYIVPKLDKIFLERDKYIENALRQINDTKSEVYTIESDYNSKLSYAYKNSALLLKKANDELAKTAKLQIEAAEIELKNLQKNSEKNIIKYKYEIANELEDLIITSVQSALKNIANLEMDKQSIKNNIEFLEK